MIRVASHCAGRIIYIIYPFMLTSVGAFCIRIYGLGFLILAEYALKMHDVLAGGLVRSAYADLAVKEEFMPWALKSAYTSAAFLCDVVMFLMIANNAIVPVIIFFIELPPVFVLAFGTAVFAYFVYI